MNQKEEQHIKGYGDCPKTSEEMEWIYATGLESLPKILEKSTK